MNRFFFQNRATNFGKKPRVGKFQKIFRGQNRGHEKTFILNQIRLLLGSPVHGNGSQYKSGIYAAKWALASKVDFGIFGPGGPGGRNFGPPGGNFCPGRKNFCARGKFSEKPGPGGQNLQNFAKSGFHNIKKPSKSRIFRKPG